MAADEVKVDDSVLDTYGKMRQYQTYEYSACVVSDDGCQIMLDCSMEGKDVTTKSMFEHFVESLPDNDCRYIFYDYKYKTPGDCNISKIIFFLWCPEGAAHQQKELYAAHRGALRRNLEGIAKEMYISHPDDLTFKHIQQLIQS